MDLPQALLVYYAYKILLRRERGRERVKPCEYDLASPRQLIWEGSYRCSLTHGFHTQYGRSSPNGKGERTD